MFALPVCLTLVMLFPPLPCPHEDLGGKQSTLINIIVDSKEDLIWEVQIYTEVEKKDWQYHQPSIFKPEANPIHQFY